MRHDNQFEIDKEIVDLVKKSGINDVEHLPQDLVQSIHRQITAHIANPFIFSLTNVLSLSAKYVVAAALALGSGIIFLNQTKLLLPKESLSQTKQIDSTMMLENVSEPFEDISIELPNTTNKEMEVNSRLNSKLHSKLNSCPKDGSECLRSRQKKKAVAQGQIMMSENDDEFEMSEIEFITTIRKHLKENELSQADVLLQKLNRQFPNSSFVEEKLALVIQLQFKRGERVDEEMAEFIRQYPMSPYRTIFEQSQHLESH